jgi:hypothetical protein
VGELITAVAIDALGVDLLAEPVSDEELVR